MATVGAVTRCSSFLHVVIFPAHPESGSFPPLEWEFLGSVSSARANANMILLLACLVLSVLCPVLLLAVSFIHYFAF